MPIPIENNSWDYVQRLIEKEINSAFKLRMTTEEEKQKEETEALNKKKERVFDLLWSPEEQRTILGLLKGRKIKKEEKTKKENEVKNMT